MHDFNSESRVRNLEFSCCDIMPGVGAGHPNVHQTYGARWVLEDGAEPFGVNSTILTKRSVRTLHLGEGVRLAVCKIDGFARVLVQIEKPIGVGIDIVMQLVGAVDEPPLRLVVRVPGWSISDLGAARVRRRSVRAAGFGRARPGSTGRLAKSRTVGAMSTVLTRLAIL